MPFKYKKKIYFYLEMLLKGETEVKKSADIAHLQYFWDTSSKTWQSASEQQSEMLPVLHDSEHVASACFMTGLAVILQPLVH